MRLYDALALLGAGLFCMGLSTAQRIDIGLPMAIAMGLMAAGCFGAAPHASNGRLIVAAGWLYVGLASMDVLAWIALNRG